MNISIEKALHKGLDDIEVQPKLEARTIRKITRESKTTFFNFRLKLKYVSIAACVVVLVIAFIGIQPYINNNGSNQPNVQAPLPSESSTTGQSGAVYHNIDVSQIIRQKYDAEVPFGFFFDDKLLLMKKDLDINLYWNEQQFTKEDIESSLHISIINPILPDGDYTTKQYVLVDDATGKAVAYLTAYYYFNKDTMNFQNSFSLFYFAEDYFNAAEIEQTQNVTKSDGETHIDELSPTTKVNAKGLPHVRKLVYLENGIGIATEAEADTVTTGSKVDEEKSLELYKQTDEQLITLMTSLIQK